MINNINIHNYKDKINGRIKGLEREFEPLLKEKRKEIANYNNQISISNNEIIRYKKQIARLNTYMIQKEKELNKNKELKEDESNDVSTEYNFNRINSFNYCQILNQNLIKEEKFNEEKINLNFQEINSDIINILEKQIFKYDLSKLPTWLKKNIKNNLEKLSKNVKYDVMHYLLDSENIYPEVFKNSSPKEWITESIILDIANEDINNKDILMLERYYNYINKLKENCKYEALKTILYSIKQKGSLKKLSFIDIVNSLEYLSQDIETNYEIFIKSKDPWSYQLIQNFVSNRFQHYQANISNISNSHKNLVNLISKYIYQLKWDSQLTIEFLGKIHNTRDVNEIERFLNLSYNLCNTTYTAEEVIRYSLKIKDTNNTLKAKNRYLESKLLKYRIISKFNILKNELSKRVDQLLNIGISFNEISDLLSRFYLENDKKIEKFLNTLEIICDYKFSKTLTQKSLNIIRNYSPDLWEQKTHDLAIAKTFLESKERTLDELLEFIKIKNNLLTVNTRKLKNHFIEYKRALNSKSAILNNNKKINNWTENDIRNWAYKVKNKFQRTKRSFNNRNITLKEVILVEEILAVISRGIQLVHGYPPREIQILSLILLLNKLRNKGILMQINTGEGKTCIFAMLAGILGLEGKKVHIITTSSELSIPQSKAQKPFFDLFNLSIGENGTENTYKAKKVYKKDIIYGKLSKFIGHLLDKDTEFKIDDNTVCLIDEVDSMFIDQRSSRVQLSEKKPGMNHLQLVIASIWNHINLLACRTFEYKSQWYCSTEEFTQDEKTKEITLKTSNKKLDNCIFEISNRIEYTKENTYSYLLNLLRDLSNKEKIEWEEIQKIEKWYTNQQEKIQKIEKIKERENKGKSLSKKYNNLINNSLWNKNNRHAILQIPNHQKQYVKNQLKSWINSAINAFYGYERYKDYDINQDKIVPIDFRGTGEYQHNTVWGKSLAQFLQIKENLKIQHISVSPNFKSNVEFYSKYKQNLYGLTGTLGSKSTQKLLSDIYDTSNIIIPPFKEIKISDNDNSKYICKELEAIITASEEEWTDAIIRTNLRKLTNNRAVLLICKHVNDVKKLTKVFKAKHKTWKVYSYTGEEKFKKNSIRAGEIIIATNIAGRGTDIETSRIVEENGGLHVCVTFLPENLRVELQNVGRTARKGQKGTGQLIILNPQNKTIIQLKQERASTEKKSIQKAKKEIVKMLMRDNLFKKFKKLEDSLYKDIPKHKQIREAIEEKWGFWLSNIEEEIDNNEKEKDINFLKRHINSEFDNFLFKLKTANNQGNDIENPYFHVLRGNEIKKDPGKIWDLWVG